MAKGSPIDCTQRLMDLPFAANGSPIINQQAWYTIYVAQEWNVFVVHKNVIIVKT